MVPDFTEEGLLPSGIHKATLKEIQEKLGWSGRRRRLLEGLERALDLMAACSVQRVYVDGSFVTDKDRPNDIDGCYDPAEGAEGVERLRRMHPIWPPNLWNRAEAKEMFGVDFFPAATTEFGSGQPFLRFFQKDREGRERGVLMVELAEIEGRR